MRGKITHFDHERIPERIAYARDTAAQDAAQVFINAIAGHRKRDRESARKVPA